MVYRLKSFTYSVIFSKFVKAISPLIIVCSFLVTNAEAQTQPPSSASAITTNAQPSEPWPVKIKKTVVFLTAFFQDGSNRAKAEGTGFFVVVPDKRLGENQGFVYFVTNRHMADPSVALGHPVQIFGYEISANRRVTPGDMGIEKTTIPLTFQQWIFSSDPSVDLAVAPFGLDQSKVDFLPIPESMFATKDIVISRQISEGDSVLFTGFFAQFPGQQKIEPVIREGILAMLPDEKIPTTLGQPGDLYLADMHSFHGNSGSPVFVNMSGFRNGNMILGAPSFLLLGIISGFMYETADLQLQAATTITGTIGANSGITTIVPIDELKAILDSPELQRQRDAIIANQHK
jgi:hypothetical protein